MDGAVAMSVQQLQLDFGAPARAVRVAAGPGRGAKSRTEWAAALGSWVDSGLSPGDWLATLPELPWRIGLTQPGTPTFGDPDAGDDVVEATDRCVATVLDVTTREWDQGLYTVGAILHRGGCLGCEWEGPPTLDENIAAEEACEHAWPGWRHLPVVDRPPLSAHGDPSRPTRAGLRAFGRIVEACEAVMPGWEATGAPMRTRRRPPGTRHHWSPTWGRWDLGVVELAGGAS
jgi:hypothetical protein